MKKYLFLTIICLSAVSAVFGQQTETQRVQQERENQAQQRRINDFESRMREQGTQWARNNERELRQPYRRRQRNSLSPKEIKEIKELLAPSPEDWAENENFLRQPNTGIFRLMPNFDCVQKMVVRVDGDCENSMLIGDFYSFRAKDYSVPSAFDLMLKNEELKSGGALAQGILVSLGDVRLEDVSSDSPGVRFLSQFKPQTESAEVKKQYAEIKQGINADGFNYGKSEKAVVNTTYAFRIIAYRAEAQRFRPLPLKSEYPNELNVSLLRRDKRIDLTLAFRIVRKDDDGSLIILWKELNRQNAPKIIFPKGEAPEDFNQSDGN